MSNNIKAIDFVKNLRIEIKEKLDAEYKNKNKSNELFEIIKYRTVVSNEYKKDYAFYNECLYGKTESDFSSDELKCILNTIEQKINFVHSSNRTLRELIEEFEFIKEISRIAEEEEGTNYEY